MNAVPLNQNQFATATAAAAAAPNAQIVNAAPQIATAAAAAQPQQALQQDPNDPTKWHVVQVASALPQSTQIAAAAPQTAQIVTANGTVLGSATLPTAEV